MSVPKQIITLLALTTGLFDTIPIEKIQEAENKLVDASADLPKEILKELVSNNELSDKNKKAIVKLSDEILSEFQDKPKDE
jgi:F-type H+/Na+-transporting ATPase subunit alpha